MPQQVFINKERRPRVRGGVTRLFLRQMTILPIGQLLGLGDLATETDGEQFLESQVQQTVLRHQFLDINAVSRYKIVPSAQPIDIISERQAHLAYILVRKEIRQHLRHAYVGQPEQVTSLMVRYLDQSRRIMDSSCKTGTGLGIHAYPTVSTQVRDRLFGLLERFDDHHLAFKDLNGQGLQLLLTDMMSLVPHVTLS